MEKEKSVTTELVIDVRKDEVVTALLQDHRLMEYSSEKNCAQFAVGDIYYGRVRKLLPGLNAAFVDVGYEKDAFLHYLDLSPQFRSVDSYSKQCVARKGMAVSRLKLEPEIAKDGKISDLLQTGMYLPVQVVKEPISTKGPRLTTELSIAGRHLVLIPFTDKVSVSQKIKSVDERKRLKRLISSIRPKNFGVIVRTMAEGKNAALFDSELSELVSRFEDAFKGLRDMTPPTLILGELDRTAAFLRDVLNPSFEHIYVNNKEYAQTVRNYIISIAPEKGDIVKFVSSELPIMDSMGVEKQIKSSFGRIVSFKSGAYLIIEHTEALHVIDVNSGNRTKKGDDQEENALDVNLAAADEIARQLMLRDMGGIIVVDFIDLASSEHRMQLYERMCQAMSLDRAKHTVLPLSKFGLMQITRQRVRPETNIVTLETCPVCGGKGTTEAAILFVDKIEERLEFISGERTDKSLILRVHPFIAAYLEKGWLKSIRRQWKKKYKISLHIVGVPSFYIYEYHFFNHFNREIELS